MNVLLVTPEYPPRNIGGGGIVYENLSKQLAINGHSVKILAGNFINKNLIGRIERVLVNESMINFIPLLPFPKSKTFDSSSYTIPTIAGTLHITKELIRSKNTVIHLHGFCHPIIDLTAFLCIAFRKKYILTCHGIPKNPEVSTFPLKNLFRLYLSTIERLLVRKASTLTAVSQVLLSECKNKNLVNESSIVISNGPNSALSNAKPECISHVEKNYSLKNKKVIFAVGRINPVKGFQFLIDAMQIVALKLPNAVAVIAGSGPYKSTLANSINEKDLSDNVKLIGWIDEESKAALYELSEVVVFTSLNEPFGLVILEALAMHKPLVAFNTPSSIEMIKKDTGILVPIGDSAALANAILKVTTDPELREKIIVNTNSVEIVGWQEITNQYVQVYDNLMNNEH